MSNISSPLSKLAIEQIKRDAKHLAKSKKISHAQALDQRAPTNEMFAGTPFNGDLSKWRFKKLDDAQGMFKDSHFNGDVSKRKWACE